jgi:hypothetical protein
MSTIIMVSVITSIVIFSSALMSSVIIPSVVAPQFYSPARLASVVENCHPDIAKVFFFFEKKK